VQLYQESRVKGAAFDDPDLAVLIGNERFERLILDNGEKKGSVIEN
jgi:hypothetical protein